MFVKVCDWALKTVPSKAIAMHLDILIVLVDLSVSAVDWAGVLVDW